ncbi:copper oxidase [Amycolatopsis balhimycina DSM 5908]|uniref:Copper oxidase n=1 Tax=Amycolatopsis balhimycina DSM 5908 TaxID=1081091 RepID=A0A428X613_AMYBA|nr:multicopper oxidase domain-containing protein [Amycolatopsis balhimycina]RSM50774.1 copper oxidase [Amycolatopsis balhimycina DSM 5908]
MPFPQRPGAAIARRLRAPHSRVLRFVVLGSVVGLTAAAAVGPVRSAVSAAEPVNVEQAAVTQLLQRPLGTAFGQQSQAEADLGDGTTLAAWELKNGVKEFHLTAAPLTWETEPGRTKQALAFNGHVPGPVIRVNQGDKVRIVVKNDMAKPTAVHWHGMELPNDQDGVPMLTQPDIEPGQSFTYEWTAVSTGTHWYHSHEDGDQEGRGLYGALEVVPTLGDIPAERDVRIMTGDGPLGFVFNGKSYPATTSIAAKVGERVHIRLIGTGPEMFHAIHIHGGYFTVVAQDGRPLAVPQEMDTVTLGIGQTFDLIWVPVRTGKWMIHCHVFSHSEVSTGMTGMVTIADVHPATIGLPGLPGVTESPSQHN